LGVIAIGDCSGPGAADLDRFHRSGLVGQAQHHDACMAAWRIAADVAQADIQGDQDP